GTSTARPASVPCRGGSRPRSHRQCRARRRGPQPPEPARTADNGCGGPAPRHCRSKCTSIRRRAGDRSDGRNGRRHPAPESAGGRLSDASAWPVHDSVSVSRIAVRSTNSRRGMRAPTPPSRTKDTKCFSVSHRTVVYKYPSAPEIAFDTFSRLFHSALWLRNQEDTLREEEPLPSRSLTRPHSLADQAADEIRRRIVSGEFELGQALSETAIAAVLGVSKTPVREALLRLKTEGLVDIQPQRGTFVFRISAVEVRKLSEFRQVLEVAALRLAMRRDAAALGRVLERIVRDMRAAIASGDAARYREQDGHFTSASSTAARTTISFARTR